jgi:hypothetical protein
MNMNDIDERADDESRRSFIRKAAYVAPMILTLKAVPAFASAGSGQPNDGISDGNDQPSHDQPSWAGDLGSSFGNNRRPHHWWQVLWPH